MVQPTLQQALTIALQYHQAGRLREAEQLYRQILAQQPQHADANHFLGVIAQQVGRHDMAVELIRRAITLRPNYAEAYSNLGIALWNIGKRDEAVAALRQAVAMNPDHAEAHNNLGNALKELGQLDQAIISCRQAIALSPKYADAYANLGSALAAKSRLDEAMDAYRQATALDPKIGLRSDLAEPFVNCANRLKEQEKIDEAIVAYRQALALNPKLAEAYSNLGSALTLKGEFDEAIAACRQATSLRPDLAQAHGNLGIAHAAAGQVDDAIATYRQVIALAPNDADAYRCLAVSLSKKEHFDEAIAACRRAIALRPDYAEAYSSLGSALKDNGQLDEALIALRHAVALKPSYIEAHSNLVFSLYFHPDCTAEQIAEEHRRWNRQHAEPLQAPSQTVVNPSSGPRQSDDNDSDAKRRLRIGYVSADFRNHVVGRNLLPLFRHHDQSCFEIFCYAEAMKDDDATHEFRGHADHWRTTARRSDEQVAQQIRDDRIDVLVDLALHTLGNRLLVFARKPAPVQVTYLGYCGTTGLTAIDYRFSDVFLDPPGTDLSVYSEQTVYLDPSYWCYNPPLHAPGPSALPALTSGVLTFGCLNNPNKVSQSVLAVWTQILKNIPSSRLLLYGRAASHMHQVSADFAQAGIDPSRIEFVASQPYREYLQTYHRIDIALDPFPYVGGITSCDSLWMGVPFITLAGTQMAVSRGGVSILSNVGLHELIARNPHEYISKVTDLANDLPRLSDLRKNLRSQMQRSPLLDAPRFARSIESAYRQMWRKWPDASPMLK